MESLEQTDRYLELPVLVGMDWDIDMIFMKTGKIGPDQFCQFTKNQSIQFEIFKNFKKKIKKIKNRKNQAISQKKWMINQKIQSVYHFSFKIWILNRKPIDKPEKPNSFLKTPSDFQFFPSNFKTWILYQKQPIFPVFRVFVKTGGNRISDLYDNSIPACRLEPQKWWCIINHLFWKRQSH
jgi:hypothetical protein